ncbi:MAG TPA: ABC transporter ATP-binding protein [Vicinamibacteria bacterium]|nr:ABC transporter ATP-binding protein [Vicinamibacteria bacterium]
MIGVRVAAEPAVAAQGTLALTLRDVGKAYRIYDRPQDRLKQMILGRFGCSWGRDFWALRGVSFELRRGEAMGVIGRNGSGKSTLLQILAGILAPTTGEVRVPGRVAALLELGSGFNPEFTGRENVFLNGAIMGLGHTEMKRRFDEIAAFADIGEFIDQPVKLYSSGMFVRLAFAVATSVQADVLLIDEALAVGDVFFRQKCYRRLEALRDGGASIMLVSHAVSEIEEFCRCALLLHHGDVVFQGSAAEAVKRYYLVEQQERLVEAPPALPRGAVPQEYESERLEWPEPAAFLDLTGVAQVSNGWARCTGVALCDVQRRACHAFRQGELALFFYEVEILRDIEAPIGGVVIQNSRGVIVHGKNTLQYDSMVPLAVPQGTRLRFRQEVTLDIFPDEYTFEIGIATISRRDYDLRAAYAHDDLYARVTRICVLPAVGRFGVALNAPSRPIQLRHHGVANLAGRCQVAVANGG